ADGENLVFRFQDMIESGTMQRTNELYIKDVCVWRSGFTRLVTQNQILRATYYTSATGDDETLVKYRNEIRNADFEKHYGLSILPGKLTPCIFKKDRRTRKTKGVDIQLCVDMLGHVSRGNVDSVLLLSGDGDYAPLLAEVRRAGVHVYVGAFSSGFSEKLKEHADLSFDLDTI
ncbi:MAG TPA: NYN domain-containing protein, partial [Casimicrobium sp.]|nr:NYN domain-containing protein [Casimicrobium sp.]